MLIVNNENSGRSFYFTQNISECNITGRAKIWLFYQTYSGGLGFIHWIFTQNTENHTINLYLFDKKGNSKMLIYDQRNFDLHLTQLNCAIANWATFIRIICRPTQMLLAFATGRPLILIPVDTFINMSFIYHEYVTNLITYGILNEITHKAVSTTLLS